MLVFIQVIYNDVRNREPEIAQKVFFPLESAHYVRVVQELYGLNVLMMVESSFVLHSLSEIFFILRRTERHVISNVYWSSCKVSVILVRFY